MGSSPIMSISTFLSEATALRKVEQKIYNTKLEYFFCIIKVIIQFRTFCLALPFLKVEYMKTRRRLPSVKNKLVTIKKSKIEGLGVFALVDIPSGTKIADYYGKEMTLKNFKKIWGI